MTQDNKTTDTQPEWELMEKLADIEHQRWSGWQKYLHSKCYQTTTTNQDLVIPAKLVEHWERQIRTPYAELSDKEKESDRDEVRRYWPLIQQAIATQEREKIREKINPHEIAERIVIAYANMNGREETARPLIREAAIKVLDDMLNNLTPREET